MRIQLLVVIMLLSLHVYGANVVASSASTSAVQAAVNSASDGDWVLIPDGSATWTSGITTTKQIIIAAQNYTATSGGTAARNVVITNNYSSSTGALFVFTTGNTAHVGLVGIQFVEGSGGAAIVKFTGTGSKVPLVADISSDCKERYFANSQNQLIRHEAQGGVYFNLWIDATATSATGGGVGTQGGGFFISSPRAWATASTMGSADTNGVVNVYLEDSTIKNLGQWPDVDDNGRVAVRYNTLDGTWGLTHGFTSTFGGRHVEYYNNTFTSTAGSPYRNLAARYFWFRGGTGIFTDNVVNQVASPGTWGSPVQIDMGDSVSPSGGYPMNRQPGYGHDGVANVSDPIYSWSNTGARQGTTSVASAWTSYIQSARDFFIDAGAKTGYAKYTYPHPLRSVISGGSGSSAMGGPATYGTITITGGASIK